ncbi:unnamed protein product [Boreogadus saida]
MGTDCGKECALCVYRLLGQQPPLPSPFQTCALECEGGVDSRKLRLCRELLLDEENHAPALDEEEDVDPADDAPAADPQADAPPEHQLVKKYGGFMKRYGGFMARRSPPPSSVLMQGAPEGAGGPGRGGEGRGGEDGEQQQEEEEEEEENIRMEILKILNAEAEGRAEAKRYGGFMRRAGGLQADPLEAVLGRALKKRYGGFMRRVGRPEWLVDDANKSGNGNGVLKRAWEDGRELQKRYGGFMD